MSGIPEQTPHFDFGTNWLSYSRNVLQEDRLDEAIRSIKSLLSAENLEGLSFLDIGCGSGLFSVAASRLGAASVLGVDINPRSIEAAQGNARRFLAPTAEIQFRKADILSDDSIDVFDVVYSWGVLHHTGRMWDAIENAMLTVRAGGTFVLALYNRHWSSALWRMIKKTYNHSPRWFQKFMEISFSLPIYLAKAALTGDFSLKTPRGMDLLHDVIDWIGGYPYEYASVMEVTDFCTSRGFVLQKSVSTKFLLGNNEFVFVRKDSPSG